MSTEEGWGVPGTVGANRDWSEGFSTCIEIFRPKKTGFSFVKNTSQIFFDFFYLYSMQLFKNISPQHFFFTGTARLPKPAQNWFIFQIINMSQDSSVSISVVPGESKNQNSKRFLSLFLMLLRLLKSTSSKSNSFHFLI